ncbi:MAG: electron transfer flavoprotein subunit alpha [Bryobacteraceae bacterium]|jgi:electron transfer flavoprotein alpha subunit
METILFLAHTEEDGSLSKSAQETLSAAVALRRELTDASLAVGLVSAEDAQAAADSIAACSAERFLAVTGSDFATARYATDAAAAESLVHASGATLVLAPHTSRWARCLAGVAQRLQGRVDTHVTAAGVESGAASITRWYYRQRIEGVVARDARPWFILIEPGSGAAWQGNGGHTDLGRIAVSVDDRLRRTTFAGWRAPRSDQQTIRPDAELLLVAGAGWTKKQADGQTHAADAQRLILGFLEAAQASLGGSKSLVDLSGEGQAVLPFMTHLNQVGQTGSTPRHPKGLATCCHGEEPHVVGWRFINERRAINLDPNCGWARGKADVLYVADAFAVMGQLNALLAEEKKLAMA